MEITAIQAVAPLSGAGIKAEGAASAPRAEFARWLDDQIQTADRDIKAADTEVRKLALGETDNLHQVMLSLERARTSLELVVQVRNRLLDAYQDVLRMQV